jgi:hypothetical protein
MSFRWSLVRYLAERAKLNLPIVHDKEALELVRAAAFAIGAALEDGKRAGNQPGTWLNETVDEELEHIGAHIEDWRDGKRDEDHLAHMVCRAAMAYALHHRDAAAERMRKD